MHDHKEKSKSNPLSKEPNFFNNNFISVSNLVSYMLITYIIITLSIYCVSNFFPSFFPKTKIISITQSDNMEFSDLLFSNMAVNVIFCLAAYLSYNGIKNKDTICFIIIELLLILVYFFVTYKLTSKNFFVFEFLQLLRLSLIGLITSLGIYVIFMIFSNMNYMRNYISEKYSFHEIVHEISLRTDMIKFAYNSYVIKTKLHRIIPGLLYKKDDFYYRTCSKPENKNIRNYNFSEDNDSVQMNVNVNEEKQNLLSKDSSKNKYLSTMGEY